MKKWIAILTSLVLLLGCCAAESLEGSGKVTLGTISINGAFTLQCGLPEGYRVVPRKATPEQIQALILSENPENPVLQLSVAFDETYSDVHRMNDLSDEELELLEKTFTDVDPTVELSYGETGLGTLLLIAKQTYESISYIDFLSIYQGYFVEFAMVPAQTASNRKLTEDQMRMCIDFLTDVDFIPVGGDAASSRPSLADLTYITNLSNYDPETNTVHAVVRHTVTLDPAYVAALKVGDTLDIGDRSIQIETLETMEEGDIQINDEISLRQYGDEVHFYEYEAEYLEDLTELDLTVPDDLVFMDEIDPATGEMQDEVSVKDAAAFIAILSGQGEETDPGFASDNTYVTFNENEEMTLVQRFYTPWQ